MRIWYKPILFWLIILFLSGCLPQTSFSGWTNQDSFIGRMALVYIPAGDFIMGSDGEVADEDEKPAHLVRLSAFWIDQTEVTNDMYTRCVSAGACTSLAHSRPDIASHPNYPVQGVAWFQAAVYCSWAGRRLPTEAEWEKSARGQDGRTYPWGEAKPNDDLANFGHLNADVVDVGSFPEGASPYGVLDMAGNVYEWVSDWYVEDYYGISPTANPQGPASGVQRILRGGNWSSNPDNLKSPNRFWAFPGRNDFDGFRCAMDAD